ncbi:hypothetical protein [Anaerovorax odorimutans]|uniref:hypothetical protein n=1 Tax=Anaerovorax odorimutans TaxID=109327 RepID=UPI00041274AD|nr:hypothetical protein [Anaerovorax odorimutans]
MATELELLSQRDSIEKAFKSLIKSGRPDIKDEDNQNLVPQLYVDLFENNYILNQALDDNHVIFKGRKGTGKSTVFLQAENKINKDKYKLPVYINLQSCYEEIRTANIETQEELTRYNMYYNFFNEILLTIKKSIAKVIPDRNLNILFEEIKKGDYIDADFLRNMQVTNSNDNTKKTSFNAELDSIKALPKLSSSFSNEKNEHHEEKHITTELRIFSINKILTKLKEILVKHKISKVYLLLDDFSELSYESQHLIIDSLISPIITSYNDMFVVKLAAYPYRIYMGNIDTSKILPYSLDFYDVYEKTSANYTKVEESAIDYVKRTIEKRIEIYTTNQITASDLFDTSKVEINTYYKTLFYASSGIPRSLGYILTYCYLSSINQGNSITIQNINSAAKKYFIDNVLADFYNDVRFKQSFYDDKEILNQLAQKNLMEKIIEITKQFKRQQISKFTKNEDIKQIYSETLKKYKSGITYWLPSSHFYVDKDIENILQTLELYFIVNKFNEGSSRRVGKKASYFGLNYGLCLENGIDYGKPEFRRSYDYWRQDEFDFTEIIPSILSSIEIPICTECNYEYNNEAEYEMAVKFNRCLKCGKEDCIQKVNKFEETFKEKLKNWEDISLPDLYINILRVLYNNRSKELTAYEISLEVEKHHLTITKSMNKLFSLGYIKYERREKRYYTINDSAISKFFTNN